MQGSLLIIPNHALRNVILESMSTRAQRQSKFNQPSAIHVEDPWKSWHGFSSQNDVSRWILGGLLHAVLHFVFSLPDVDLALSYACLGKDHGALLVLGLSICLCVLGAWLRDDLMVCYSMQCLGSCLI